MNTKRSTWGHFLLVVGLIFTAPNVIGCTHGDLCRVLKLALADSIFKINMHTCDSGSTKDEIVLHLDSAMAHTICDSLETCGRKVSILISETDYVAQARYTKKANHLFVNYKALSGGIVELYCIRPYSGSTVMLRFKVGKRKIRLVNRAYGVM